MAKQQVINFENGATLIYQKQSAFNGYSFAVGFRCGAQLDGKYKGLSHLLEHLLFRTPNPKSTNLLLDNVVKYTVNQNAYTSDDCICVTFSSVYKNVEQALANLKSILTRTRFSTEQIKREIEIVKHEINMYKEDMQYSQPSAFETLIASLSVEDKKQGSLDILGNSRTLNLITPELLSSYVKKYFNLNNLIISVTTNKPIENVVELCQAYILSALKPATSKKYIIAPPAEKTFKNINMLCALPDEYAQNVSICLLLRERSEKAQDINLEYAYNVFEEYLLNGMGGILWDALRIKNQLTYDYEMSNIDFGNAKFKSFDVLTNPTKMRKTIYELCKVIREIGQNGVPKDRFDKIKTVLTDINSATLKKFKAESANSNFTNFLHGNEFIDYKKVNDYISKITYEEFNDYIMNIYSTANASLAIDGKFDSRKCYTLLEVEKMLGNYSHVEYASQFNPPRVETTDIPMQFDLSQLMLDGLQKAEVKKESDKSKAEIKKETNESKSDVITK